MGRCSWTIVHRRRPVERVAEAIAAGIERHHDQEDREARHERAATANVSAPGTPRAWASSMLPQDHALAPHADAESSTALLLAEDVAGHRNGRC